MPQPQKEVTGRSNPPHNSYKHISIIFMILAILLILGVTYLALSKVTITLYPSDEKITHEFDLLVYQEIPTAENSNPMISGKVITETNELTQDFSVTEGETVDAIATGTVTLYNDRETAQPLVATTRLLSPENILFRLEEKVVIPAQSTLTTEIYADVAGVSGNIAPTDFIIPGLNESLQTLVYAKSETPMTGGTKQIGILTQTDVDQAYTDFGKDNSANLLAKYINDATDLTLIDTNIQTADLVLTGELGEQVDNFSVTGQVNLNAVFADKNKILEAAKNEVEKDNSTTGSISIDPSSLTYELKSLDIEQQTAIITVTVAGLATLNPATDIFDKNMLVGFTKEDLELYFSQFNSISSIDVTFSPFWVSKVPILKDHIDIQIAK